MDNENNNTTYNKKHYQTFKAKHAEKIKCDVCKCSFDYYSKSKHLKSKRHREAMSFVTSEN